jgi:hypothetical protein
MGSAGEESSQHTGVMVMGVTGWQNRLIFLLASKNWWPLAFGM